MSEGAEILEQFDCFGSTCAALVIGSGRAGSARDAVSLARSALLSWHRRFSRFLPDSELSLLNRDPRPRVPVRPLMARFAQAVRSAGSMTGGLVDATLLRDVELAGYTDDLTAPLALAAALELAPARTPARAAAPGRWRRVEVDLANGTLVRPPGVELDSGGLAKGLFADVLAETLASHPSFAIDCAGDLAIGGAARMTRPLRVESPFDGRIIHTFHLQRTGVATSGIGRRSWLGPGGEPAHHLLDPSTGRPAFTGVVQVTALAQSALVAEIRAKAAILSGPDRARAWLPDGGVIVFDDGAHQVIDPPPVLTLSQLAGNARAQAAERATATVPATSARASVARSNAALSLLVSSSPGSGREMK
jgi:FAD:protein FMN transferase